MRAAQSPERDRGENFALDFYILKLKATEKLTFFLDQNFSFDFENLFGEFFLSVFFLIVLF